MSYTNTNSATLAHQSISGKLGKIISPGSRVRRFPGVAVQLLNQHCGLLLLALMCIYLVITITLSSIKLLWLDEFITYYISRLGSFHAIWLALSRGADPNPPLNYLLVLLSTKLFGDGEIALRLPAIVASGTGLVGLFLFLRRRVSPIYATAGALFFMCTAAFDYSFESRSYPLLLAFSALSLVAWRSAIEGRHRLLALLGLTLVLAAGLSSNYFAVLAFFPIAIGEFVRDLQRRKVEWGVWVAMAIAGATLLFYIPLINKAVATFSPHAWNKVQLGAISDSYLEMVETILWPALGICAAGLYFLLSEGKNQRTVVAPVLPRHEAAATLVLILYPVIAYGIARVRGGMLSPRFVIPLCYGFAIATTVFAQRLLRKWDWAGLLFLSVLLCWFFARESVVARMYYDQHLALERVIATIPPEAEAIAVPDSLLVLPLYYYAPDSIRSRIVFPVDFDAIRKYKKEDSPEQNLWHGRDGIYPVPIVALSDFAARNPNYLIVATMNDWLVLKLVAEDDPLHILPIFTDTKDIQGFTPLSHGHVWFFAKGSFPKVPFVDATTMSFDYRSMGTHANSK